MGGFTRLRNEDFRQEHAVAEGFMRSVVVPEHDDPLRMAKHFFGSGFFLARRSPWPQSPSRTRMLPSSRRISTDLPELGRWSNKSPPGSASWETRVRRQNSNAHKPA